MFKLIIVELFGHNLILIDSNNCDVAKCTRYIITSRKVENLFNR